MSKLITSSCEKDFILNAIADKKRLDGRECYDYRQIGISFGADRGCVLVELGNTKVLAQVSCSIGTPKHARPSEGLIFVNVELSPMAHASFEEGKHSNQAVEISRILERCIKESKCVDTEALCIMAGLKVWQIRVDVHVLDHNGNLIDACSIAAITALAHFRRPDVTVSGEEVTVHSFAEKDPIPLSVFHMPICVTFVLFRDGQYLLVDPTYSEEIVSEGKIVFAMNKHREICDMQVSGMTVTKEQIFRCSSIAFVKVSEITKIIQDALAEDDTARPSTWLDKSYVPFKSFIKIKSILSKQVTPANIDIELVADQKTDDSMETGSDSDSMSDSSQSIEMRAQNNVVFKGKGLSVIGEGGPSKWTVTNISSDSESEEDTIILNP